MFFEEEMYRLEAEIAAAQDINELNYLRATHEKKYWWTSIFINGLFYAINGDVGKMIISWIISFFTLGIYAFYIIYTSYRDQKEFNDRMEYYILKRTEQLQGNVSNTAANSAPRTFKCPECGTELNENIKFCPTCGKNAVVPQTRTIFCMKCGEKITNEAKFCPVCGNKVRE